MTLDHAHDLLLALTALSLLLALAGLILRRRPREPECPRCLYRHAMPEAERCPECGHEPTSHSAWTTPRPRLPKRLRRWSLIVVPVLAIVLTAVGVLHGRWASVMPSRVFVESLRLMPWCTVQGQSRMLAHAHEHRYSRGDADRLIEIALRAADPLRRPDGQVVGLTPADWQAQLFTLATDLTSAGERVVIDHRHPPFPVYGDHHAAYLASSPVCGRRSTHAALLRFLDEGGYECELALVAVQRMHEQAAPMASDLLPRLHRWPRWVMLAGGGLFADPIVVRRALQLGTAADRDSILNAAAWASQRGGLPARTRSAIERFVREHREELDFSRFQIWHLIFALDLFREYQNTPRVLPAPAPPPP